MDPWLRAEVERLAGAYRFFHWHLAFPDVFSVPAPAGSASNTATGWNGGFSVVLGNPPWVRYQTTTSVKKFLTKFATYRSTADLSVFFLERSVQITQPLGRVALLTPNKWFGAGYGDALREWLRDHSRVQLIVDFGHSRTLFPDADTFPAAVVVSPSPAKVPDSTELRFVKAHDGDRADNSLQDLIARSYLTLPHGNLRNGRWCFEDLETTALLDRLLATGTPLSGFVGRAPAMGINSGFNDAFYIDDDARRRLIDEHPGCENLIKRFLRGRDLKRWTFNWERTWHIVLPSSLDQPWPWAAANSESEAEAVFRATYPSLYRHLILHEDILRRRTARGKFWWELRSCEYYADYETPKILVQGIAYYSQFSLDPEGCYINNMVAFIPSSDLYLLAILNSRVTWWLINHTFQPRKDGGRSLDIQHLLALPIPNALDDARQKISAVVTALIQSPDAERRDLEYCLNALVQDAFELSSQEVSVLERSLPPRDPIALLQEAGAPQETLP